MSTITSADAVYILTIPGIYSTGQSLYGFAVDDVYDTESLESAEVMMGVDGYMSAGFVFVPIKQGIALMGDSPSVDIFETWYQTQQQQKDVFFAGATIAQNSLGKSYTMTKGVLTGYSPMSDAKKVMQPRKFTITWQSVTAAVA